MQFTVQRQSASVCKNKHVIYSLKTVTAERNLNQQLKHTQGRRQRTEGVAASRRLKGRGLRLPPQRSRNVTSKSSDNTSPLAAMEARCATGSEAIYR